MPVLYSSPGFGFYGAVLLLLTVATSSYGDHDKAAEFHRQAYIGVGSGVASLRPVAENGEPLIFDHSAVAPTVITFGRDFTSRVSAELQAHELGRNRNGLEPISYRDLTLSALFYWSHRERSGFSLYGRLGLGDMDNRSDTRIQRDHDVHPVAGFGLELASARGLAMRADYWYHDSDARSSTLTLLYRFGKPALRQSPFSRAAARAGSEQPMAGQLQSDNTALQPVPSVHTAQREELSRPYTSAETVAHRQQRTASAAASLLDQAADSKDTQESLTGRWCPVGADFTITQAGCSLTAATRRTLTFQVGSAILTEAAERSLNRIAVMLRNHPQLMLDIRAHTDNRGDPHANVELGTRRARAVAVYLIRSDVPVDRLSGRSHGGNKPIANNDSAGGRRINRRVELVLSRRSPTRAP